MFHLAANVRGLRLRTRFLRGSLAEASFVPLPIGVKKRVALIEKGFKFKRVGVRVNCTA